jgi:nucleotide-binding universal stress UspA family protein
MPRLDPNQGYRLAALTRINAGLPSGLQTASITVKESPRMAYQTIAVIMTDAEGDAPALQAAIQIAQRDGSHLDVYCIGVDPARFDAMPVGATAVLLEIDASAARERADAILASARAAIPDGLERVSLQSMVISNLGLDSAVARLARYADLVVATRPYGPGQTALAVAIVEAAIFGSGAPVLIAPPARLDLGKAFRRPLVAWNETEESMRAIRLALPSLRAAAHVDLVIIDPPSHSPERSDPGGSISVMLARHGAKTEVSVLAQTMPRVSDVLLRFAREHGNDLVVMGAYGHSRFRESLLGGATREMLEASPVPLLMAH